MLWAQVRGRAGRPGAGRLAESRAYGLDGDQDRPSREKRQRAAPARLGDRQARLVFVQEVDLNLGFAALLTMLLPALAQTRRLMTKPMHVR